jgi:hypothetical protein
MATIQVGTPGSSGTVNAQFLWSATSGGSYAAVTGAQMTAMTATGIQQIEIRGDRVNAAAQGPFFKLQVITAVAPTPFSAIVQGGNARFQPASQFNDANVLLPAIVV